MKTNVMKTLSVLLLAAAASACSLTPKHADLINMPASAPAGNVQFAVVDNGQYKARLLVCDGDRAEVLARNLAMSTFGQYPGSYRVEIERIGFHHFACYEKPTLANLAQDLTIVGFFFPNLHYPYARYNLRVYQNQALVYQNTVDRKVSSRKHDLNVNGIKELNEEAIDMFLESYRDDMAKAATAASAGVQRQAPVQYRRS